MLQVVFNTEKTTFEFFVDRFRKADDNSESYYLNLDKQEDRKMLVSWMIQFTDSFIELDDAFFRMKGVLKEKYTPLIEQLNEELYTVAFSSGVSIYHIDSKRGVLSWYFSNSECYPPERLCVVYKEELLNKGFKQLRNNVLNLVLVSKQFYSIISKADLNHGFGSIEGEIFPGLPNDILTIILARYSSANINAINFKTVGANYGRNPDLIWKLFVEWNALECAIARNKKIHAWKSVMLPKMDENSKCHLQSKSTGFFDDRNIQMYFKAFAIDLLKLSIKCAFAIVLSTILPVPALYLSKVDNLLVLLCLGVMGSAINAACQYVVATSDIELKQASLFGCSVYYPSVHINFPFKTRYLSDEMMSLFGVNLVSNAGAFGFLSPFFMLVVDFSVNRSEVLNVDCELSSSTARGNSAPSHISFVLGCAKYVACIMLSYYGIKNVSVPVLNHMLS